MVAVLNGFIGVYYEEDFDCHSFALLCCCWSICPVTAESGVPLTVLITEPYDGYTISIEYTEMLGEARFIYSTNRFTYDEYDAIKIARERIIAFTKEKGYFSYSYMRPTITKTDYEKNKTYFYSFVLFDK